MYLLNAATTIEWVILPTLAPPALGDLDLVIIDPAGTNTYESGAILPADYTAPTATTPGNVKYIITPFLEGLWRIRLVIGTAISYQILSKVEMWVFDSTITTAPYSDEIGRPVPYDINYYLQGFVIPGEIYGSFVASRTISLDTNSPGSKAICEVAPLFFPTVLNIVFNGIEIGTITFGVGQTIGTVVNSAQIMNAGDKLQLVVSANVDEKITDIAVNLVACCTVVPCTVL